MPILLKTFNQLHFHFCVCSWHFQNNTMYKYTELQHKQIVTPRSYLRSVPHLDTFSWALATIHCIFCTCIMLVFIHFQNCNFQITVLHYTHAYRHNQYDIWERHGPGMEICIEIFLQYTYSYINIQPYARYKRLFIYIHIPRYYKAFENKSTDCNQSNKYSFTCYGKSGERKQTLI